VLSVSLCRTPGTGEYGYRSQTGSVAYGTKLPELKGELQSKAFTNFFRYRSNFRI